MFAQVVLKLTGPMDHLRLVWQTGEALLDSVVFDENPEGTRYNVLVALQEMVTNVLRHAYHLDESRPIEVEFALCDETLQITLRDQGPRFDPLQYDTADVDDSDTMPAGWNTLRLTKCARVIATT